MKWDLDLWYELWDRAGSQGLDTWYDPRGGDLEGPATDHKQDTESPDAAQEGAPGVGLTGRIRHTEPAFGGEYRRRARSELGTALLAGLLFAEVATSLVGAGTVFFACIVLSWLVLPAVVGFKNVLDAGCFFMLVSLGIVVVVSAAS